MLQNFGKHLEKAKLRAGAGKKDIYTFQYHSVLNTIRALPEFNTDNLHVINMAVYAWMPTILKKSCKDAGIIVLEILNEYKRNGTPIKDEDVEKFYKFTNNSYVGASKFLHFIAPDRFAIWDSKVAQVLAIKNHNSRDAFMNYQNEMRAFSDKILVQSAMDFSKEIHGGLPVTKLRAIEHCLWMSQKK